MSESVSDRRDQIIAALDYPRSLMEQESKRGTCSQHYQFNEQADDCNECLYILECQAYGEQLASPSLVEATFDELQRLLRFAIEYVSYHLGRLGHDAGRCDCELCTWLRSVTPLLEVAA
ncbi:hypothetical protein [Sedimenticola thiotaurini]|nr:hypothetical protein [Sedimenticola thiotaurini]